MKVLGRVGSGKWEVERMGMKGMRLGLNSAARPRRVGARRQLAQQLTQKLIQPGPTIRAQSQNLQGLAIGAAAIDNSGRPKNSRRTYLEWTLSWL